MDKIEKASQFIKDVLDRKAKGKVFIELPEAVDKKSERLLRHPIKSHSISANEIWHIKNNHGEGGRKITENSIPLRNEDIALLPYIMAVPDRIEKGTSKLDTDIKSLRYTKKLSNGYVIVVEQEEKFDKSKMATITMWADKQKSHSPYVLNAQVKTCPLTSTSSPAPTTKTETGTVIISPNDIAKILQDYEKTKLLTEKSNKKFTQEGELEL